MSTKHILTVLFFCGFALLTVSVKTCENNLLEGDSCIIKLKNLIPKEIDAKGEIKWSFSSIDSSFVVQRKQGQNVKTSPYATIQQDGLKLQNVKLNNTGTYTWDVYDAQDKVFESNKKDIRVYAKALKPTVTHECKNGNVTLKCDTQKNDKTDLTITWIQGKEDIKVEKKEDLFQTSKLFQDNKEYSCRVENPVSKAQSDILTVSCNVEGPRTLFGYDFWIMVGILSGGGALLLLLVSVLVSCACRSCKQHEKEQASDNDEYPDRTDTYTQADEEELRLRSFDSSLSNRQGTKVTARGQPAPPVPQEDSYPATQTPPQTQSQAKGLGRARPPPPPQDEEEPPPLPRPRKKREKRAQEPYRPME